MSTKERSLYILENHPQDSRVKIRHGTFQTLSGKMGTGGGNVPMILEPVFLESRQDNATITTDGTATAIPAAMGEGGGRIPMVEQKALVRRLSPLECERLQGYPDGWTDIGDWVDSRGKKHKGDADSPRYKALGNSIALPFWQWMAGRMAKHLPENATMASLFDGIGGFPLVFSRSGVKPVWASEVEEFCIAVTQRRFPDGTDDK